ncbi:MAG: DMT family transporter [Oscillospiraceae bacterium]
MENKKSLLENPKTVLPSAMLCCLLWGSAFPLVKIGFSWLNISSNDIPAEILYAGLRFTLAGLIAIIITSLISGKFLHPTVKSLPRVFSLSMFQTILQYLFFYIGLSNTSGVKASVIEAMNVFVALIVSCLIFRMEKFTAAKVIGSVIGFAGVVIINVSKGDLVGEITLKGEGFILISTVAYAFSSVLMKHWSNEENPMMMSAWQFLLGGIVMTILGFSLGGRINGFDVRSVLLLIYLASLSAVAYSLWASLLKYYPVSKIAVYGFMNPVFGFVLSAFLLGESEAFGLKSIAALILVCLGIYIVNCQKNKEKA